MALKTTIHTFTYTSEPGQAIPIHGVLTAQDDSLSVTVARYCQSIIP